MNASIFARALAGRIVVAVACATLFGCQSAPWPFGLPISAAPDLEDPAAEPDPPAAVQVVDQPETPTAEKPPGELPVAGLSNDRWVMSVRPMTPGVDEPEMRWHHVTLDATIAAAATSRPDLSPSLANPNPVVAANVAIIIGRWKAGDPVAELTTAVRNENLTLPLRQAAIETLGMMSSDAARQAIDELLGKPEPQQPKETRLTDVPEIHAELLSARAKHVSVLADPRFTAALKSPSALIRREAASAWARNRTPALETTPTELFDLLSDSDTRVRVAALRAAAINRHPRSAEYLARATHDFDVNVRLAAIAGLGELGSEEAKRSLDKLRKDPSEMSRAAVVGALAALGADEAIIAAATDRSPRVRQAVAESLKEIKNDARQLKRDTEALAHQLVKDTSSEVQRRAVESLRAWPLEQAGPALLLAMEQGTFLTRKQAAAQLAERWPPAKEYYSDAQADRRTEQLADLRKQWERQFGTLDEQVIQAAATEVIHSSGLTPDQFERFEQLIAQLSDPNLPKNVRQRVTESLEKLGPSLVATLEKWTMEDLKKLPPDIYTSVLPEVSPFFASLERLASSDPQDRRLAATELAAQLSGQRLSDLALNRLAQIIESQTDPIVWQTVLALISSDPRQVSARLAYIAVANASSEVRRRACEYLQTHADRRHLKVLLPMLDDPNVTVTIAAVRAISAAGVGDPEPLIRLLNVPDKRLRLEAAIALARSQAAEGIAAIERLSRETDLEIRRAATVAMGEIGDPVFLPALLLLIEDRRDIQLAAMASLAKIAGRDAPQDDDPSILPDEKVRRWKRWFAEREHGTGNREQ